MLKYQSLQLPGTIWKFHIDLQSGFIFIEFKNPDQSFSILNIYTEKIYPVPQYEGYAGMSVQLAFPLLFTQHFQKEAMLDQQMLACHDLDTGGEKWLAVDFRVEEFYKNLIKVYHPKIEPKRSYYIDFERNVVKERIPEVINVDYRVADLHDSEDIAFHEILWEDFKIRLYFGEKSILQISRNEEYLFDEIVELEEGFQFEYDYLMVIGSQLIFTKSKTEVILFELHE